MRKIILSHGDFAKGAYDSLKMLVGTDGFEYYTLGESIEEFVELLKKIETDCETVVLTDIFGGTPYNEAIKLWGDNKNFIIFSGFNMPMLLELKFISSIEDVSNLDFSATISRHINKDVEITDDLNVDL